VNKGIIVMALAGAAFFYLVIGLVDEAEKTTPGLENSQSRKEAAYAKYYKKDINGDDMLNFSGVSLATAKAVWLGSTVKHRVLGYFPDFDTMNQIAEGQLEESEFKHFLLKKFTEIEDAYIGGEINLDQAKSSLETLR